MTQNHAQDLEELLDIVNNTAQQNINMSHATSTKEGAFPENV